MLSPNCGSPSRAVSWFERRRGSLHKRERKNGGRERWVPPPVHLHNLGYQPTGPSLFFLRPLSSSSFVKERSSFFSAPFSQRRPQHEPGQWRFIVAVDDEKVHYGFLVRTQLSFACVLARRRFMTVSSSGRLPKPGKSIDEYRPYLHYLLKACQLDKHIFAYIFLTSLFY